MFLEISNWIDKKLKDIEQVELFRQCFHTLEITKDTDNYYLTNDTMGIGLVMDVDYLITSIHFSSGKSFDKKDFIGDPPNELSFDMSKKLVNAIFGIPNRQSGGIIIPIYGYATFWDKYYFDNYTLHLTYNKDSNSIDLITLASKRLESYFDGGSVDSVSN